ncbi:hypothetical protein CTEN210_12588 [Chaetoceros tenuissimus]|uniref:Reelin domain-containing protein n=1 Tax=Chaetoceros tenuissimus TaxID=426638 RepID=A0AAD3D1G5_9STRA|nr:hypothetical protein CTEN210_12588 [Chaetoceros tenuissimus]
MRTFTSLQLYAFIIASLAAKCYASSNGASHCFSGTPGGFVTAHGASKGGLSTGNLALDIDGVSVSSGSTISLDAGTTHTLTLSGSDFKGFLFRLNGKNGENVKNVIGIDSGSSEKSKISTSCNSFPEIGGITHTDAGLKSSVSVTLSSDDLVDTTLEVTVVVEKYDPQTMYHEAFDFSFVSAPTKSPSPSMAPTLSMAPSVSTSSGSKSSNFSAFAFASAAAVLFAFF